jgi:hypothetical protein
MAILFIKLLLLMFGHKRKNAKFDENNCRHLKANFDNDKVFGFELFLCICRNQA